MDVWRRQAASDDEAKEETADNEHEDMEIYGHESPLKMHESMRGNGQQDGSTGRPRWADVEDESSLDNIIEMWNAKAGEKRHPGLDRGNAAAAKDREVSSIDVCECKCRNADRGNSANSGLSFSGRGERAWVDDAGCGAVHRGPNSGRVCDRLSGEHHLMGRPVPTAHARKLGVDDLGIIMQRCIREKPSRPAVCDLGRRRSVECRLASHACTHAYVQCMFARFVRTHMHCQAPMCVRMLGCVRHSFVVATWLKCL